jgi:hypothetical protein
VIVHSNRRAHHPTRAAVTPSRRLPGTDYQHPSQRLVEGGRALATNAPVSAWSRGGRAPTTNTHSSTWGERVRGHRRPTTPGTDDQHPSQHLGEGCPAPRPATPQLIDGGVQAPTTNPVTEEAPQPAPGRGGYRRPTFQPSPGRGGSRHRRPIPPPTSAWSREGDHRRPTHPKLLAVPQFSSNVSRIRAQAIAPECTYNSSVLIDKM